MGSRQQGQAPGERLGLSPIATQVTCLDLYLARVFPIFKFAPRNIYLSLLCVEFEGGCGCFSRNESTNHIDWAFRICDKDGES